jgi:hypothetical protein
MLYSKILRMLEKQLACVEIADGDPAFVVGYRNVLRHLRSLTDDEIRAVMRGQRRRSLPSFESIEDSFSSLPLTAAEALLADPDQPRAVLERLARQRFSMTPGEISRLSSRAKLLDRLQMLVANERTHEVIGRVASISRQREGPSNR